jgi:hypothetical protein
MFPNRGPKVKNNDAFVSKKIKKKNPKTCIHNKSSTYDTNASLFLTFGPLFGNILVYNSANAFTSL